MRNRSGVVFGGFGFAARKRRGAPGSPNIIPVVTDDLTKRDYLDLGRSLGSFASGGTFFHNAFVTTALCCPSRVSMIRGQYPHNTGVMRNGGAQKFRENGKEASTVATMRHRGCVAGRSVGVREE